MASKLLCLTKDCGREAEYICECEAHETYLCNIHLNDNWEASESVVHKLVPLYMVSPEGTKRAILDFLTKETSEQGKLKKKMLNYWRQNLWNSENNFEDFLKKLECDSRKLGGVLEKISQTEKISRIEQDPILKLLSLNPNEAISKIKAMKLVNRDSYSSTNALWEVSQKIEKMMEILFKEKYENKLENRLLRIEKALEDKGVSLDSPKETINHKTMTIENQMKNEFLKIDLSVINLNIQELYSQFSQLEVFNTKLIREIARIKEDFKNWKKNQNEEWKNKINSIHSEFILNAGKNKLCSNSKKSTLDAKISKLKSKKFEILNSPNDSNKEGDFRKIRLRYKKIFEDSYYPEFNKAYQDYVNAYIKSTSLYLTQEFDDTTYLVV